MAILGRWHGYTVDGQDAMTQASGVGSGFGSHPASGRPAIRIEHSTGTTAMSVPGLGNAQIASGFMRFRLTALPSGTNSILVAFRNSPAEPAFRAVLTSTGTLRFQDSAGASFPTPIEFTGIVAAKDYTVKWQADVAAGTLAVQLWDDDTQIGTTRTGTGVLKPIAEFRAGTVLSTPVMPLYYAWDIIVTDALEWISWPTAPPSAPARNVAVVGDSLAFQDGAGWQNFVAAAQPLGYDPAAAAIFYRGVSGKEITPRDFTGRGTLTEDVPFARAQLSTVDTWIVGLGTNEQLLGVAEADFKARVTDVLEALEGDRLVLWIGLASGNPASNFDQRNGWLRDVIGGYPNTRFVDWEAASRAPFDASDWVYPTDSVHMTASGYERRAEFLASLLTLQPFDAVRVGSELADAVYVGDTRVWP